MFLHLVSQLRAEVNTIQRVLVMNNGVRELLLAQHSELSAVPAGATTGLVDENAAKTIALANLLPQAPSKVDWQIYDHCAALTRLYAVYERFVGDLVNEYVSVLPTIYQKYSDLPPSITTQHRRGIGHILLKMGESGRYKYLQEQVIVRDLAAGLSGESKYTLLPVAFFTERQNLRFEVLTDLFSALGFQGCARFINRHSAVVSFIKSERADSSSAQKELHEFIEYRNEAAHRKVENVLAIDAIAGTGRFLIAICGALADMAEEGILRRRMELGHYSTLLKVTEVLFGGYVVIGVPDQGVKIAVGDDVIVFGKNACRRTRLQSVQLDGEPAEDFTGNGSAEVGVRLENMVGGVTELRALKIPIEPSAPVQLQLDVATPIAAAVETADTDVPESEPVTSEAQASGDEQADPV